MNGRKLLNYTLRINAAFSFLPGLGFILFDQNIADILSSKGLGTLTPTGISLIIFSVFVFFVSMMKNVNKYLVGTIITMDILWVIGSLFLIVFSGSIFTTVGLGLISIIAIIIALFAFLQISGLRNHQKTYTSKSSG